MRGNHGDCGKSNDSVGSAFQFDLLQFFLRKRIQQSELMQPQTEGRPGRFHDRDPDSASRQRLVPGVQIVILNQGLAITVAISITDAELSPFAVFIGASSDSRLNQGNSLASKEIS